jgi:hypothetical protein
MERSLWFKVVRLFLVIRSGSLLMILDGRWPVFATHRLFYATNQFLNNFFIFQASFDAAYVVQVKKLLLAW